MKLIKTLTHTELYSLIGKIVRFKSDCVFFKNFDITCKIISIKNTDNTEYIFECENIKNKKKILIGSNMVNLRFKII